MLGGVSSTNITDKIGFGYCDAHPNKELGGTIAYNPYQQFANQNDYNTKTAGTSGGDPIDISWAVDSKGQPVNLGSIRYVRVYTGAAAMNGIFGEISTEVCGIAACTGTTTQVPTSDFTVNIEKNDYTTSHLNMTNISLKGKSKGTIKINNSSNFDHVYINGEEKIEQEVSITGNNEKIIQIIAQKGEASPYVTYLKVTK